MLQTGILNPHILSLVARVRHTNTLVIADVGFPSWPEIESVDICLTRGIPTVLQVFELLRPNFKMARIFMAKEFKKHNARAVQAQFQQAFNGVPVTYEAHNHLKRRVPQAIGLIRTGDDTIYSNLIIESA